MEPRTSKIRNWLMMTGVLAALAGCTPHDGPRPPRDDTPEPGITISGTAVMGVAGGSGKSTGVVSGIKDLDLVVGVALDG